MKQRTWILIFAALSAALLADLTGFLAASWAVRLFS